MSKSSKWAPAYTLSWTQVVAALIAAAAIAIVYRDSIRFLASSWQRPEYSHCALIPILSVFLLWQRWPEMRRRQFQVLASGLTVVVLGLAIHVLCLFTTSTVVDSWSLVMVSAGTMLTLIGWNAFKRAIGPIALLLLMVPLPDPVHDMASSGLLEGSLYLGTGLMQLLQISVLRVGSVLDFGTTQLTLNTAASGLSLLLPLLSLAVIMGFFVGGRQWVRLTIVLSTIPIAVLMNSVHLAIQGLQLTQDSTYGNLLHALEGWAVFMVGVVMLVAELWLLLVLSGDRRRLREALAIDLSQAPSRTTERGDVRLRVLVVTSNFAPEMTGIGKYVGEMTSWMSREGLEVHVVTAPPYYPAWRVANGYSSRKYALERLSGALVYRCPLLVPRRPGGITRILHTISFALSTAPIILWEAISWRPHLVFVVEPPLSCAPAAILAAKLCGARSWLHVQDFEVDAAFDLGVLRNQSLRQMAFGMERWLMRRFDSISSISPAMLRKLGTKGVEPGRITYFPNWVDCRLIYPLHGENRLRSELGISQDMRVLLYSGNMGEKQGLGIIIEVARMFSGSPDILFIFCGDGAAKRRTMDAAKGLQNVRFISLQPLERLNELLNLADVHLLPQRAEAEDLVMPSKLTAILASGRPVVASARGGSDVAEAAAAGGLVVAPGDAAGYGAAIRSLLASPDLRVNLGKSGRRYAVSNWDRDSVLRELVADLESSKMSDAAPQHL